MSERRQKIQAGNLSTSRIVGTDVYFTKTSHNFRNCRNWCEFPHLHLKQSEISPSLRSRIRPRINTNRENTVTDMSHLVFVRKSTLVSLPQSPSGSTNKTKNTISPPPPLPSILMELSQRQLSPKCGQMRRFFFNTGVIGISA